MVDLQKKVEKVERNIKHARVCALQSSSVKYILRTHVFVLQDNWQPALEKLVASIGEKFSAAFDRKLRHRPVTAISNAIHVRFRLCRRDPH